MNALDNYDLFAPTGDCIEPINAKDTYDFLLNIHYAGRIPSISYAYGLFEEGDLVGVITYGRPPADTQRTGVCGPEMREYVFELNRLCLRDNKKNQASRLIGASLRLLPPAIILSYADPEHGHHGGVYRATNWIYCGMTAKRTEWKIKGLEHLHSQTIADKYRHHEKPSEAIRAEHGDNFYLKDRPRKHRYVIFTGDRRFKKSARKALKYEVQPYKSEEIQ